MDIPKVSVIIPAKGRAPYLDRCLQSVIDLNYPYFDIILVDDGLDENAKRIIAHYSDQIKVLSSSNKGPSSARNVAGHYSDAKFLAFTDSDCLVERNWLNQLLKGFQVDETVASCGGIQKLPQGVKGFQAKVFLFFKKAGLVTDYLRRAKEDSVIKVSHNASCNVIYKRDIFLKEGGFLEGLWPGEDVELDYRLKKKGYSLVFNPKAIVYHYRPRTFKSFLSMIYRYGFAQGFLVRRYGIFRRIQLLGSLSIFFVILFLWASFFSAPGAVFFALAVFIIGLVYFSHPLLVGLFIGAWFSWLWGFFLGMFKR